jgi:hypothetical protein
MRRGLLANFPPGTPLIIVAPHGAFDEIVAARNDAATVLHAFAPGAPAFGIAAGPHVIVEGLDALDDPAALLAHVRAAAPQCRMFVLASNAAYLPALAAFFSGAAPALARPLVLADLEALLAQTGWSVLAIEPIAAADTFPPPDVPGAIGIGPLTFHLADAAMLARVTPGALLAVADPA